MKAAEASLSEKRWLTKPIPEPEHISLLTNSLNLNPFLAQILIQKGIFNFDQAKHFFNPDLEDLLHPFLMKDMEIAIKVIAESIENKEKILVYGDYDVDGTTSVACMFSFLRELTDKIEFYIPDRFTEGYGISAQGVDFAHKNGFKLVIALDCGIRSVEIITLAKELGVNFIVCDHHIPGETLPPALANLNPKRKDCSYPFKELSGCGIGFKLIQACCIYMGLPESKAFQYLDLVAVSIASDLVQMNGENRILTYFGIEKIRHKPCFAIEALCKIASVNHKTIDVSHIVFAIGPRINAAGRLSHAKESVNLLIAQSIEDADIKVTSIDFNNQSRRDLDQNITEEALSIIEKMREYASSVVFKSDWHKGVVGIVASRCIEKYYKPTIVLTQSGDKAVGSARSVLGFDLYEALCECSEVLTQFGGHTFAAGMTLPLENVDKLREKFEEVVQKRLPYEMRIPTLDIDVEVPLHALTEKFYQVMMRMSPFGPGNMQPVFLARNVKLFRQPLILKEKHIKLWLKQGESLVYEAIGFNFADKCETLNEGDLIDICFTLGLNEFRGLKTLQLFVKDLKSSC